MRWFSETRLIIIWFIAILIELTFQSEILIIRHGRSRSRHSVEKDHVRWGLKALDNLTIVESHEEFLESAENETNGELNVVSFFENNGSLSQSSEFNGTIGSYEINFTHGPLKVEEGKSILKNRHDWYHRQIPPTTEIPKSAFTSPASISVKRRSGRKKEIMTNIKNTVNKGIQYLKSHENLDEIEIEINDHTGKRTGKNNKKRSQSNADQASSTYLKQQQQQQHKIRSPKKIKINGKELGTVTIFSFDSNTRNKIQSPTLKFKKSNKKAKSQRRSTGKHIKNHQVTKQIAFGVNSNLADVFYIPTSTEVNPLNENPEQMQGDEPTANNEKGFDSKEKEIEVSNQQHNLNTKQHPNVGNNSSLIPGHNMTVKHSKTISDTQSLINKARSNIDAVLNSRTNIRNGSENFHSHVEQQKVIVDVDVDDDGDDHERMQPNNDINVDIENEELINAISMQNDDNSNNKNNVEFDGEIEEISNLNGIYQIEDLDLSDFDETTRINRKNLMRGRDVVTRFLQIVESQHVLGGNCTAGTALNLGEGVVDRYAQDRFRVEAEVAVNRANMLTRIFKLTSPDVYENINLLHASVLSMVEFDDDIFAAGHCFDWNQYSSKKGLFCPFAHRLPPPEIASLAKDLAQEYHYLGNTSEWFFLARKNAEKVIAKNEQYIKAYHSYTDDSERHAEEVLSVKYEDGRWSKPYYDCGGGNIWMLTYTVPFFGYENGTYFFKGTSGIDIDLRRVDIDQCPQKNTVGATGVALPLNIFAGTDKCKQRTTECVPIPGLGFRRGSYKCICRRGFYYPDVKSVFKYFNGSSLEEEYAKLMQSEVSFYNDPKAFECLPCAEGCDSCEDASPCVAELNWPMRTSILILACAIIGFLPPAAVFTFRYQQVKVVKAASPALLRVIAMGAFLIYCTTIVMYPPPSLYTCVAKIWLREIGFSLTYGALMLKTWRISVIFRVRSAKAVKITDASLIKKLGLLCGFVSVALLIRTLVSPPDVIVGRTADNLKAFLCKTDWWDHTFTSLEVLFLAWGVRLCIVVRKAPSEFNESRFISMAIYNEFLLTCFLNVSMLFLQSPANPDLLYIIFFCHTQLTVTLLLALIFGSKVYLVFRNGGKSLEDAMHNKSSTAKFISRSQPRTYASASSVNASTGQLHYQNGESKLSDNDVVEEIKLLTKQLQNLYDRIPQRGPTTNVILTLLDICRTAQTQNTANALTLRPPTQPQEQSKNLSICDGKSSCVDKETNTSFDNLMWQNLNDINTRVTISDSCDNDNHSDLKGKGCRNVKCCETNNTTKTINCSTSSINFDNLQLQCMCSSDNNSLEDCEIENCDNCSSKDPQTTAEVQRQVEPGSFRERLLNFTNSNTRNEANNLRKRNSELVLGTSFDTASMSVGVYKGCQNYRISCDNIFSSKSFTTASATSAVTSTRLSGLNDKNSKSNHSLSGDSDKVSKIPYSFLERPTMKLSQSEDKNLRELKIALSSTLPDANKSNNNKIQVIENLKTSYNITQQSHSLTSSSSTSSKVDKVSSSLSSSSTSDAIQKKSPCQPPQYIAKDESNKHLEMENINNQDERNEDNNKMITTDLKHTDDNKNSTSSSNANNNNLNAGNNDNSKKRKTPEGKLAIDLNDRSKFTEEVSV